MVMLISLDRCRKLLGADAAVSDEELTEIRESLYQLAHVVVSAYTEQHHAVDVGVASEEFEEFLKRLPPEEQEEVEKRAAALVQDKGMCREKAERVAITEYIESQRN